MALQIEKSLVLLFQFYLVLEIKYLLILNEFICSIVKYRVRTNLAIMVEQSYKKDEVI